MNWRVLTVVSVLAILALSSWSNSWQQRHFAGESLRAAVGGGGPVRAGGSGRARTAIERTGAFGGGDAGGDHSLAAARDAEAGVQQLTSDIEKRQGVLEDRGGSGGAAAAPAASPPPPPPPSPPPPPPPAPRDVSCQE